MKLVPGTTCTGPKSLQVTTWQNCQYSASVVVLEVMTSTLMCKQTPTLQGQII